MGPELAGLRRASAEAHMKAPEGTATPHRSTDPRIDRFVRVFVAPPGLLNLAHRWGCSNPVIHELAGRRSAARALSTERPRILRLGWCGPPD